MFEISVKTHFSAAHHLRGYKGMCATPHGHNWEVQVCLRGERLNSTGFLVDFREVKTAVGEALADLDHQDLNTLPQFSRENPTSEHLARYLYGVLSGKFRRPGCRVKRVSVSETPGTEASYEAGSQRKR